MAAFTNLALSASSLATRYVNKIYVIERGQYDELGNLLICVLLVNLVLPILTVAGFYLVQRKHEGQAVA
jgi:hypothetical protein